MIDPIQTAEWIAGGRAGLELLRSAWSLLPKGGDKDEIAAKLDEAEHALRACDAKLAKELGFRLCQCEFPPRPMLWNNRRRVYVCQNPGCRRTVSTSEEASDYGQ